MIYVIINSITKRVATASLKDDTIVSEGYEKLVIDGDFSVFPGNPCDCIHQEDGSFLLSPVPVNPIDVFDPEVFQTALFQLLLTGGLSSPNLRLEFAAINQFVINKDFVGLSQYCQWLVAQGIATQDDFTAINNACKAQGVDLTNL